MTDSPFRLHVLLSSAFFRPINYSHNYVLDENNRHFMSCPAAWWSTSAPVDQVAQKAAWQMFLFLAKHLVRECVPQACDLCCHISYLGCFLQAARGEHVSGVTRFAKYIYCAAFMYLTTLTSLPFLSACRFHCASLRESPTIRLVLRLLVSPHSPESWFNTA